MTPSFHPLRGRSFYHALLARRKVAVALEALESTGKSGSADRWRSTSAAMNRPGSTSPPRIAPIRPSRMPRPRRTSTKRRCELPLSAASGSRLRRGSYEAVLLDFERSPATLRWRTVERDFKLLAGRGAAAGLENAA